MKFFTFPPSFYDDLGISKKATQAEIKTALNKMTIKYHPDRNPGNKFAEEKMKVVNEMREVLIKYPELKENYDQQLENYEYEERIKEKNREERKRQHQQRYKQENSTRNSRQNKYNTSKEDFWLSVLKELFDIFADWQKNNRNRKY